MNIVFETEACLQQCSYTKRFSLAHLLSFEKAMGIHSHDFYEIFIPIKGGKQICIGDHYYNITPNDVFIINQYENHYINWMDKENYERYNIAIFPSYLERLSSQETPLDACFKSYNNNPCQKIVLSDAEKQELLFLISELTNLSGYGKDINENITISKIMLLLNKNYESRSGMAEKRANNVSPSYKFINDVFEYINEHITEDLCISNIAKQFYMSESYVSKKFKQNVGITVNDYIVSRRISLAKSLLRNGMSPGEVCGRIGYNDYSSFYKAFLKTVKVSPRQFIAKTIH